MSCCGQNTTGAGAAAVDTGKRVNYVKGMLLGVDDFVQEQAWGIARRHELARELLGYGTVRGLKVSIDPGVPRVRVSPGMAWTPSGAPVCVGSEQCCDVNAWLLKNHDAVQPKLVGNPAPLTVYVVLAYAALPTDKMPIPGEPCRSEEALMADSRFADCFRLELRLAPPDQVEENAIRDFADWLARIPVDPTSPPLSDDAFEAQLREAAHAWLEPTSPHLGDFMFGSPPPGLGTTDAIVRAALRLWATELRPRWRARYGCGPDPLAAGGSNDAVLLAALSLSVFSSPQLEAAPEIGIDETQRPVLMSLRMVQELIAQNPAPEPGDSVAPANAFDLAPTAGTDTAYSRADHSHGTPVLPPLAGEVTGPITANTLTLLRGHGFADTSAVSGDVLTLNAGGLWEPERLPVAGGTPATSLRFGEPAATGVEHTAFARADHTHGTPTLAGDAEAVSVGAAQEVRVRRLQNVPVDPAPPATPGHVLTFGPLSAGGNGWSAKPPAQAVPAATAVVAEQQFGLPAAVGNNQGAYARADHTHGTPPLTGDVSPVVSGGAQQMRVGALQGVPVRAVPPGLGQMLAFDGQAWTPTPVPGTTTGDFVEREAGRYRMVTAGHAHVELTSPTDGQVKMFSSYSKLTGAMVPPNSLAEVRLRFNALAKEARNDKLPFIVKLTPVWSKEVEERRIEFSPYLVQAVRAVSNEAIEFDVRLRLSANAEKGMVFELQIEVSRFEA